MKNNSKEVVLEFNIPEFNRKDISIKLSKNAIVINAKKKTQTSFQRGDFFHKEKSQRVFNYTTTLPAINPKKAKITFTKGVLKIVAPKK